MKHLGSLSNGSSVVLSVVVPVFNEAEVLQEFNSRLSQVLVDVVDQSEVIYVDDGSTDESAEIMLGFSKLDPRISIVSLTRNFGKEIALTAGLDYSRGDAVVVIDADLQDPPELIHQLLATWRQGYDVVNVRRLSRRGETRFKTISAKYFYRCMSYVGGIDLPRDTGDFRLLSRRAVIALGGIRERNRFMKGLFVWIGFPQTEITFDREHRHAGESKWNFRSLADLAIEGLVSFSTAPLRLASYLGLATALASLVYGTWIILKTILFGDPVAGYPSLMVVVLFLGSMQLITLGIIGEYLGRTFNESKQRPLYIVGSYVPASTPEKVSSETLPIV